MVRRFFAARRGLPLSLVPGLAPLLTAAALLVAFTASAAAQADPAPFDLAAALAKAAPGATISVPPGDYPGSWVLDKPVTLVGEGMPALVGPGEGDVVHVTAPNVTLRGFVVRGSGISLDREDAGVRVSADHATLEDNRIEDALFGIYLEEAPFGIIRGNTILGMDLPESRRGDGLKIWYSADTLVEGNTLRLTRDAVIWFSPRTTVRNNVLEDGRYGLHFMSTDDHLIENNVVRGNSVGIYLMYGSNYTVRNNLLADNRGASGYGLGLKETNKATIEGNRFVNNRVGIYSDASPLRPEATVEMQRNLFAYNEIGLLLLPNVQHNVFTNNIFLENGEQVTISGGGDLTLNEWQRDGRGNYWSDYRGFDADGDTIGDLPYESQSLYESMTAKYPELRLFHLSPAADAIDLAARAFPIFQPRAILADPSPLMQTPELPPVPGLPAPDRTWSLIVSSAMVAAAIFLLAVGRQRFGRA